MAKLEKSIRMDAPVEKVFAFMTEPSNLLQIWPSLVEIRDVQPLPNGGYSYDWTYKMAGLRFGGRAECTEFVKDRRTITSNEGSIPSTFLWAYQPDGAGTRLTVTVEYAIPGAAVGRLAEPIIHKMNEHEAATILANLKACVEAYSQSASGLDDLKFARGG